MGFTVLLLFADSNFDFHLQPDADEVMTIQGLRDWNKNVANMADKVKEANQKLLDDMNAGSLSAESVIAAWMPVPAETPLPNSRWARWFLREWGWAFLSRSSDTQSWLPWGHPDMIASRERLRKLIDDGTIHPALTLNFDQVWRSCYQFGGTLLMKDRSKTGLRCRKRKVHKRADKKLHAVKGGRRGITDFQIHFIKFCFFQCSAVLWWLTCPLCGIGF